LDGAFKWASASLKEEERRKVREAHNEIERDLAAQLIDSYAGKLPIEFWTAVERFRQFVRMRKV
jgi:hypothetical protein